VVSMVGTVVDLATSVG